MRALIQLQNLDLQIEACKVREQEIPKQKGKLDIHRKRLAVEIEQCEQRMKSLQVELRECESDITQKHAQISKYNQQLLGVKKNEEYQALLHEIELIKKQIGVKEEKQLSIMMDIDDAKAHLAEDKKRIQDELAEIDRQAAQVDEELQKVVEERKELEKSRGPLESEVAPALMSHYKRIRSRMKNGPCVVPLNDEVCTGCHMRVIPQVVNELLAGNTIHTCKNCGRLLYAPQNIQN